MRKFREKLLDRKGVAIEMALLVMVVTFSFSILITATTLLHYDKKSKAEEEMKRTVAIEQIAKSFCELMEIEIEPTPEPTSEASNEASSEISGEVSNEASSEATNEVSEEITTEASSEVTVEASPEVSPEVTLSEMYPEYEIIIEDLNLTIVEKDSGKAILQMSLVQEGKRYRIFSWKTK